MPPARVIEAVDLLKDGGFALATGFPRPAPDQRGLDGLEECLDKGVHRTVKARNRQAPIKSHLARCRGNLMAP